MILGALHVSAIVLLGISAGLVALGAWIFTHREYVLERKSSPCPV